MLEIIETDVGVFILKMDKSLIEYIEKMSKAANITNVALIRSLIDTGLKALLKELTERQ